MTPTIEAIAKGKPGVWSIHGTAAVIDRPRSAPALGVFKLLLQVEGQAEVAQSGRRAHLAANEFALIDGSAPFRIAMADSFRQVLVTLPRKLVTSLHRGIEHQTATAQGGTGSATLVRNFLVAYAGSAAQMSEKDHAYATSAVAQLMGALDEPACQSKPERIHQSAIALINNSIAEVDAQTVSAQLGISRRYLDLLFSRTGRTFSEYLWDRRLVLAADRLQQPGAPSITEVAHSVGFKDSSHFSRAFHRRFGMSPRAWRQTAPRTMADLGHQQDQRNGQQ